MPDRDPFDKDFDFDEPEDYWQIERPKRKFSLRNHWVMWLIGVNCISLFVMLFLYSDGHPIDFVMGLSSNGLSEEELLRQDAQRIQKAVSFSKGEDVIYSIHRYMGDAMWEVYYKNDQIKKAKGNSFVQVASGYYYLSADRQRLYKCLIDEPEKRQPVAVPPRAEPEAQPIPAPVTEPQYEYVDEFYRDSDGTWKNRKREIEVKRDGVSGDPIPKIVYDDSDDPRDVKR